MIYLLTSQYPYSSMVETFIIPELQVMAKKTGKIKILTVYNTGEKKYQQPCPSEVKVEDISHGKLSIIEKTKYTWQTIMSKEYYDEIRFLKRRNKLNFGNLIKLLKYSVGARRICNSVMDVLHRDGQVNNNTLLYSYWMTESAYAIAMISKMTGIVSICRAHGYDYDEDRNNGYIPMRRYILHNSHKVFPASVAGVTYIAQKYGYNEKIKCSYLGTINEEKPREASSELCFRIVTCAYAIPLKRIDLVARALLSLTGFKIEWVQIGDGPEIKKIIKLTECFPDEIKFRFLGNCSQEEIRKFYSTNYVGLFVNVSDKEGGVPTSIKEAMSYGIPALVTDVGGNKEIVINAFNGTVVPADISAEGLGKEIMRIIRMDKNKYMKFRDNAYIYWKNNFNAYSVYPEFYKEILTYIN